MGGAARAPEARIDQRESREREGHKKNERDEQSDFRRRDGHRHGLAFFAEGQRIRADDENQADDFDAKSGEDKNDSGVRGQDENDGSEDDNPSGEQQEKSRELHAPLCALGEAPQGIGNIT